MNENNEKKGLNKLIKTKKVEAFFNEFIFKTKKISNAEEAKTFRKKLLITGIISFFVSICTITISILGFIFLNKGNYHFIIPSILMFLGIIILIISIIIFYIGLVILVTGEATKFFDETKVCPNCYYKVDKAETICPNCNKEL